ncbi:hypothetical protein [Neokomagataea anthophila]|uniref:LapA family protein n=1 Tax=Neokomagataea anthophila TaxID=2826925 RepID=A0ABS5E5A6_9PROT|nr:hypothetical protein [Neokomagataea anthophila]MBR0559094.1 hypothetical protein [Neokomagataea anthophila]
MFDLTWLPDWLLVFAGLFIALGLIVFLLMPFTVLAMRVRIARLEAEVRTLQGEAHASVLTAIGRERQPVVMNGWHTSQGQSAVSDMPWGCSDKNVEAVVEQRSAPRKNMSDVRSRAEPRLRWPPPK